MNRAPTGLSGKGCRGCPCSGKVAVDTFAGMRVRFWGVRGSIASPGPSTVRYGGNTTCIEVRADDGTLIVLDGGTGIYVLAQSLLRELPVSAHVFLSHTHWDHIQGLPFFTPLFIPGNRMRLYGAHDPVSGQGIEAAMGVQLQYRYFPVREAELKATLDYRTLDPGEPVELGEGEAGGGACVVPTLLSHPVVNFGYRVSCRGRSVFFTGDYEPPYNIYDPSDEEWHDYQAAIDRQRAHADEAMRGVDVLIVDSAYTPEEYRSRQGWGHGTYDGAMAMARRVGAKKLICTHHEPSRSDDALEKVFREALERFDRQPGDPVIELAYEGLSVEL